MRKWSVRAAVGAVTVAGAVLAQGSAAWAFHCYNPTKPTGAGSKGTVVITPTGESFVPDGPGQGRGGFVTLDLTAVGGETVDVHAVGPVDGAVGALSHMPEKNLCDGKGIDDVGCLFGP